MTTVLQYLIIAAVIGLVVFLIAVLVFGRGEQLAPLPPRTSPARLPDQTITGSDVRDVRLSVAVRGYRMSDVDWVLQRVGDELDRLRAQVVDLGGDPAAPVEQGELLPGTAGSPMPGREAAAAPSHPDDASPSHPDDASPSHPDDASPSHPDDASPSHPSPGRGALVSGSSEPA